VASIAAAAAAAASSVGVTPQAEAPSSAPVAPRNALRRRLRRRTCTARARTQRHRFVLRARAGQSLRVRAQLLRRARASKRTAKGAGRSMANGEMVGSSAVRRRAWSRPQRGAEARIAQKQKGWRTEHELKGVRASTLKGCCARLFQGPQDKRFSYRGRREAKLVNIDDNHNSAKGTCLHYGSCLCLIASLTAHVKVRDHRAIQRVNPRGVLRPIAHRSDTRLAGRSVRRVPSIGPIAHRCRMSDVACV